MNGSDHYRAAEALLLNHGDNPTAVARAAVHADLAATAVQVVANANDRGVTTDEARELVVRWFGTDTNLRSARRAAAAGEPAATMAGAIVMVDPVPGWRRWWRPSRAYAATIDGTVYAHGSSVLAAAKAGQVAFDEAADTAARIRRLADDARTILDVRAQRGR